MLGSISFSIRMILFALLAVHCVKTNAGPLKPNVNKLMVRVTAILAVPVLVPIAGEANHKENHIENHRDGYEVVRK